MNSGLINRKNSVLILLGLLVLVFNLWLLPLGTDGKIPLDLKFGYDKEEALRVLEEIGEDTLPKYRFGLLVTDMVYPFVYGSFLGLLLLRTWKRKWILVLPAFVMVFDFGENLSILALVDNFPAFSESDVQRASFFSSLKWGLVIVTFSALFIGLVKGLFNK